MAGEYLAVWERSINDPDGFWREAAEEIDWITPPRIICDPDSEAPATLWFTGGELNTCANALDRHVAAGRGEQIAIIHDSPVTGSIRKLSYSELLHQTARFAGVLKSKGVTKSDRVILYMPMVPEAVIATLACARLGAVHSIVFGGFAANELAVRINDCKPKVIVAASCGIEPGRLVEYKPLLDDAIDIATHKPDACIILQRPECEAALVGGRDATWREEMANAAPAGPVTVAATDPLYILYTSGTTGLPKGIVRDNGGHAVVLKWSMKNIYGVDPGEVYWAASDVGWVVGHSYIIYAPLLHGCTSVMYEGKPVGTPDPGAFWRVCAEHNVACMFTAPTAIRAIRQQDPDAGFMKKHGGYRPRYFFVAGERCDPDTLTWCQEHMKVPVIDHWWQTETGWPIASNCLGIEELPVKPGSPTRSVPGWNVQVLDDVGHEVEPGTIGAICVKRPLPPSVFPTLWGAPGRYVDAYFKNYPGYYETGDAGIMDEDGYIHVMARTDDVINVAGHRLSTGAMEEVLASHPDVSECAVIGAADALKGQLPVGMIVLPANVDRPGEDIAAECVALVRGKIGPVAAFKSCITVKRLPKTRSGKILRGTMQKIADGEAWNMPATIEDPAVLPEVTLALETLGYAGGDDA